MTASDPPLPPPQPHLLGQLVVRDDDEALGPKAEPEDLAIAQKELEEWDEDGLTHNLPDVPAGGRDSVRRPAAPELAKAGERQRQRAACSARGSAAAWRGLGSGRGGRGSRECRRHGELRVPSQRCASKLASALGRTSTAAACMHHPPAPHQVPSCQHFSGAHQAPRGPSPGSSGWGGSASPW